ncbi:hypothetical protein ABIF65_007757 [Bradyrhizobium japonicum]|uniref:hypothetical protein n=1 Tax=Bradyrhizobium TaxID=374 RepID=UPI000487E73F|nr:MULTISPECIES: hypothetical protein [Bradyrhizobium]MBR0881214.1 hypothetical protein [Bradyrhizobium liaoningense]MBR1000512.1 hypothetical protein [Bradyrhizobium liaoningense]MBR1067417.1 hypothetical protein [Bradyrhizobium liaoningense]MCP1775096.1 hypothetical protein [Bradyrhizobium japonicum]MCP1863698.1 hypothetical protein [Bradyrhizobium japonicum]
MTSAPAIQHVVLACDESGAKGYADRDEQVLGEVGVFAGIMVPGELLTTAQATFDAIAARYQTSPGKVHITDLAPGQQAKLREEMFQLITELRLPCFFEAVHVAGFHVFFRRFERQIKSAQEQRQSRIKLSLRGPTPDSLHVALFFGLYSKLLAFCMERDRCDLHVEVRTDQVDDPIFKDFQASARKLLDFGATVNRVTGFDPDTKQVLKGTVETAEVPPEHRLPITIHQLDFRRVKHLDGLVLAADVLANSLAYLYRTRPPKERYRRLNRPESVAAHPLALSLDAFNDWGAFDASDLLYPHPCDPDAVRQTPWYRRWLRYLECWIREWRIPAA